MNIKRAYQSLPVAPMRYLLTTVVPGTFITLILIMVLLATVQLPLYFDTMLYSIPIFIFVVLVVYPLIRYERDESQIDQEMHLFITRMGILSLSEISGKGMFYILEEMKEYGRLAVEVNKVHNLVRNLEINISEACREVARSTPSELLADFFNRLAHAIETGEDPREFFKKELEVVMDQYSIKYEGSLTDLGLMNEVFVAVMVLAALIVVMFLIVPMIVELPLPPLGMLVLSTFMFGMIEGTFLFAYWIVLPRERLWQKSEIRTEIDRQIVRWLIYSFILCGVLAAVIAGLGLAHVNIPIAIAIAIVITPLALSGYKAMMAEVSIKKKEDRYPAFMRSLGIAAAAKGGVAREALAKLRYHDFAQLTGHINDLYKRLSMRVDELRSWKYFHAEVGSDLISKFSDMYIRGTMAGANPKEASSIVSSNFIKMLQLRKKRYQASRTLLYILYGVTITIAVSVFMTIFAVDWMVELAGHVPQTPGVQYAITIPILSSTAQFDIPGLYLLGLVLIIVNAFMCATIIRLANAGHPVNFLFHFVGLVWTGVIVSLIIEVVMKSLRTIGG